MSKTKTLIASESKKGREIIRQTCEIALNECGLGERGLQRVIHRGRELQTGFKKLIMDLAVAQDFANEDVCSSYAYPAFKVKPIAEQVETLQQYFPKLSGVNLSIASQPLPDGAEGYYAIPRWESIASTYGEAVENLLAIIAKQRKFYNYRSNKLTEEYLRQHARTSHALDLLAEQQPKQDILVVAVQFGLKHRGRSVRRAREVFASNEFGLGAFAIGCMLITHPERLVDYEDLWIDCAGDEYSLDADGQFGCAPCFFLDVGELRFNANRVGYASGHLGSASGFLPTEAAA